MAGNEGAGGYPWQSLRDSTEFVVVTFDPDSIGIRPFWNGPGSPLYVPTPMFAQFAFTRNGFTSYSPWISIAVNDMVIARPRVSNGVSVVLNFRTLPGLTYETREVNL